MDYTEGELEMYHLYLEFARRKTIEDFGLKIENIMDLEIDIVSKINDNYLFKFFYNLPLTKRKTTIMHGVMSYERWKTFYLRDKKLSQIL